MANWCSNRLSIVGHPERVSRMLAEVSGTDDSGVEVPLDFERILPTPQEFAAGRHLSQQAVELVNVYLDAEPVTRQRLSRAQPLIAQMAMDVAFGRPLDEVARWDVTDWRTHNWGTKWRAGADSFRVERGTDTVSMIFSTAGTPPRPLVMELIQRHADLSFDLAYSEPDDGFAGRLAGERAAVVIDVETREPDEAAELLTSAGWEDAVEDWQDPDDNPEAR